MTDPTPEPGPPVAPASPPPRAFAQGTGVLFQVVGFAMFVSTCCVCSAAGRWEAPSRGATIEKLKQDEPLVITLRRMFDEPGAAGLMLTVSFATVGGLAMMVFGLGLQSDKPNAAYAAVATCALLTMMLLGAAACLWIGESGWVSRLWNHALAAVTMTLLGFAIAALRQIRRDPPPPGMDILPDDFEIPRGFGH